MSILYLVHSVNLFTDIPIDPKKAKEYLEHYRTEDFYDLAKKGYTRVSQIHPVASNVPNTFRDFRL